MTATKEEVIQFNCTWCGLSLTVPAPMAGISGPCPKCGNNITSPLSPPHNALPTSAFSSQSAPPSLQPTTSSLPQSAFPANPHSSRQNGNGNALHPSPLGGKLELNHLPGPSATGATLPQPGSSNRGSSLPSLRPLSAVVPESETASPRPLNRESGRHAKSKRRGALIGALLMVTLALAGTGIFFKDQVSVFWKRAQLKWKSSSLAQTNEVTASGLNTIPPTGAFDPAATANSTSLPTQGNTVQQPAIVTTAVIPTPPILIEQPEAKPPFINTGSVPPSPVPGNEVKNETLVKPPLNVDPPKALPVDDPSSEKTPSGLISALNHSQTNPGTMIEVRGLRNSSPGKGEVSSGEENIYVSASSDAQPAAAVLKQFFTSKTWQDRLAFTRYPEKMRPLMERYYSANSEAPLRISRIELIRHDRAPELGSPHCVFQVSGPAMEQPLPIMVESSDAGWKVDWLTFIEFKDKLLLRFLQTWSDEPGRFHVMMRRAHYFDEDVPDLKEKYCFELTPPDPGASGFVFVPKGTPLARELDKSLGWEITNVAGVVELQWRKKDRYQWVEMTAVPQYNWRGPDPVKTAVVPDSTEKSTADTIEKAVPALVEKASPVESVPPQPAKAKGSKK